MPYVPPQSQGIPSDAPNRPLSHQDIVISNDYTWYCFYYSVSQTINILQYQLKRKLVLTLNAVQPYHTINYALTDEALDLRRNQSVLVYIYNFLD